MASDRCICAGSALHQSLTVLSCRFCRDSVLGQCKRHRRSRCISVSRKRGDRSRTLLGHGARFDVEVGGFCRRPLTFAAPEVRRVHLTREYRPKEPSPSKASSTWRSSCSVWSSDRSPTLSSGGSRAGSRCRTRTRIVRSATRRSNGETTSRCSHGCCCAVDAETAAFTSRPAIRRWRSSRRFCGLLRGFGLG